MHLSPRGCPVSVGGILGGKSGILGGPPCRWLQPLGDRKLGGRWGPEAEKGQFILLQVLSGYSPEPLSPRGDLPAEVALVSLWSRGLRQKLVPPAPGKPWTL